MEIGNFPEKEFRIMIVKLSQDLGKRKEAKIEKTQEMLNKDLEELRNKHLEELNNKQTEMNNIITEILSEVLFKLAKSLLKRNRNVSIPILINQAYLSQMLGDVSQSNRDRRE